MFDRLLHICKHNKEKTPLEDFTTALFCGILENCSSFRTDFFKNFLKLEKNNFTVKYQKKYNLENYDNCIIDMVIESSDKEICFIENKVNSKEGHLQLHRYSLVLDKFKEQGFKTKLVYCTKRDEPKDISEHNFLQIKWYEIANFCKSYKENKLIHLFIEFLNHHNMNKDMTLRPLDLVSMENFSRVFDMIETMLDRVKPAFEKEFGDCANRTSLSSLKRQIQGHNRFCFYKETFLKGNGYSEVLFGLKLSGKIYIQIFIRKEHTKYSAFIEKFSNYKEKEIGFGTSEWGASIYLEQNLSFYLNNENSEIEIEKWYRDAFKKLKEITEDTTDKFNWNYN